MHGQYERRDRQLGDGGEIARRVVGHLGIERDVQRDFGRSAQEERVAVGRALRDNLGADHAARSAAVVDHHVLSPLFSELLRDRPPQQIVTAAGRIGNHDANRLGRVALCAAAPRGLAPSSAAAAMRATIEENSHMLPIVSLVHRNRAAHSNELGTGNRRAAQAAAPPTSWADPSASSATAGGKLDGARAHRAAARSRLVPRSRQRRGQGELRRSGQHHWLHARQPRDGPGNDRRPAGRRDQRRFHGPRRLLRRRNQGQAHPRRNDGARPAPAASCAWSTARAAEARSAASSSKATPSARRSYGWGVCVREPERRAGRRSRAGLDGGLGRGEGRDRALLGDGERDLAGLHRRAAGGEPARLRLRQERARRQRDPHAQRHDRRRGAKAKPMRSRARSVSFLSAALGPRAAAAKSSAATIRSAVSNG